MKCAIFICDHVQYVKYRVALKKEVQYLALQI